MYYFYFYLLLFYSLKNSIRRRYKKLEQLYAEVAKQLHGMNLPPELAHIRTVLSNFSTDSSTRYDQSFLEVSSLWWRNFFLTFISNYYALLLCPL